MERYALDRMPDMRGHFEKIENCPHCLGRKFTPDNKPCTRCNGKGKIKVPKY